ncbi:uncharacterized protein LOC143034911 [Oratosquilla oratoria]|uniref:uncharacterized protein LOC143034911 n=1 Tax=Oratosquilla oratoria TaxID=337810 RepID=UPI003F776FD6
MIDNSIVNTEARVPYLGQNAANTDTNNNDSSNNNMLLGTNDGDKSPGSPVGVGGKNSEKYGLRPRTIIKRLQLERSKQEPSNRKMAKPKAKAAPLSKYRRKTANARERHRMKEINTAFETLRKALPDAGPQPTASSMTKITTLRLAVNYIKALSNILEDGHASDICSFQSLCPSALLQGLDQEHIVNVANGALADAACVMNSGLHSTESNNTNDCTGHRGSLSSASDIGEFFSENSGLLEDEFDSFPDIPVLPESDPFDILLESDGESLTFGSEFSD